MRGKPRFRVAFILPFRAHPRLGLHVCLPFSRVITKHGSHIAYREGFFGESSYMQRVALDFLDAAKSITNTGPARNAT